MLFKQKISYWRIKRELSQNGLAKITGISQSYISKLEKDLKTPSIPMLFKIAEVLEVCWKDLIGCDHDCKNCTYKSCNNE